MTGPMRGWLAACAAIWVIAAGCGVGRTPNANVAPEITSVAPDKAIVNVPFDYAVAAKGMTPMSFSVVSGPAGFEVHPGSGVVTWTPAEVGTASIEIRVTNLAGSDSQFFDVDVEPLDGPVFTTDPPTDATVGAPYAYDPRVVAREEVTWSAPVAPDGLSIDPETGSVRWTPMPTQAGDQPVTIRATETASGQSTDQSFTIVVIDTGGPAIITSTPPERVFAGQVWRYSATAAGAPTIQWSLQTPSSGTPASGVVIATAPPEGTSVMVEWDTATASPGDYTIALQVDNGLGQPNTQEITVTVDPRPPVPEIDLVTTPPPATIFVGSMYDYDVELVPGTESAGIVFSLVGATVPSDLAVTIDPESGQVAFSATESNGEIEYRYTVRAQNVLGEGDEATIAVDALYPPAAPMLTVTPATAFTVQVGSGFPGASATATGNPDPILTIAGTLPDFLEFDPLTGSLTASTAKPAPEESDIGQYAFDIVAASDEGTDSVTIDITVVAAPPAVDSITPAAGRRQSAVPVVVRGAGFVASAAPVIRLELGEYRETLATTFIDEGTLSAIVPIESTRPPGVYDVVVDQGSTTALAKRFTVTDGDGSVLSGTIGENVTLTAAASPHIVTGNVRIEGGATVTAEPGAVVMFDGDSNLRIDVGTGSAGALVADGGEPGVGDQVVFTRFQEVGGVASGGHYRGLRFGANTMSAATLLRNVVVEFGGRRNASSEQGAIEVLGGAVPRIHQSVVRESLNYGLYARAGAGSDTTDWFDQNQLTANGRAPISIGSEEVSTLGPDLDLSSNGQDRIFVRGSTVSRPNATWRHYGVPYYLSAGLVVRGGGTLRIAAGNELRFAASRLLRVSTGGANGEAGRLVAAGTPTAPIRMVADVGTWNGLHLDDNVQAGTALRNVRIEGFSGSVNGGLRVDAAAATAIVENCSFESAEAGSVSVYLAGGARLSSFENNVLVAGALSVDAPMPGFSDVLTVSSIFETPLRVRGGSVAGFRMSWARPRAGDDATQPIRPSGTLVVTNGALHIAAGNRIEMPLDGQIIMNDSSLVVDGTASAPVFFEPASTAAYWNRILLRGNGADGESRVRHAVLAAPGSDPSLDASTQRAAIVVSMGVTAPSTPAVSDTTIVNSNGYGMTFADGTHCGGGCADNVITGSRFSALRMHANYIGRFGDGNALVGNNTSGTFGHEGVWVVGDVVDTSATWPSHEVPYVVQGDLEVRQSFPFDPVPVMTIEPGAELRFASNRRLRVGEGNDGILDAQGTGTAPIVFTSVDDTTPVYWRGIDFNQGSDGSTLDHVVVSYGGGSDGVGNVNFRMGAVVTVGAATLSYSEEYAAAIYDGSAPMFVGPPTSRVYARNGQAANPGVGDPAFDCVVELGTGACDPL